MNLDKETLLWRFASLAQTAAKWRECFNVLTDFSTFKCILLMFGHFHVAFILFVMTGRQTNK